MSELSFEEARTQLEQIVRRLEREDLELERALELYEQGQSLARYCQAQLDRAELRIQELSAQAGE